MYTCLLEYTQQVVANQESTSCQILDMVCDLLSTVSQLNGKSTQYQCLAVFSVRELISSLNEINAINSITGL